MKIYTRTGDKGETSLYGGKRVLKSSERVETYGMIDELNSTIGVVVSELVSSKPHSKATKFPIATHDSHLKNSLEVVQHDLFAIGSHLATPNASPIPFLQERIDQFEQDIDMMTQELPELMNFILPGGGKAGAMLHMSRTVCRRAERELVRLSQSEDVDRTLIKYVNRLSDVLFTMARYANFKENKPEIKWIKR